jgi:hypothetical protein
MLPWYQNKPPADNTYVTPPVSYSDQKNLHEDK